MNSKTNRRARQQSRLITAFVILSLAISVILHRQIQTAQALSSDIVIRQVYGGGGNAGAPYRNDFVELFNRGTTTVSLSGMSVQYASATGTGNFGSNPVTALSGSLAPGQSYLVQQASGGGAGALLPTPDVIGTVNMSGTGGKVALVNSSTGLACNGSLGQPCSAAQLALIKDLVGWDGANFFETAPAPATTNPTSVSRLANGCMETDNNAADFAAGAPTPRNTASPLSPCVGATTLNIGDVTQAETNAGTTTFTFNVTLTSAAPPGGVTFTVNTADGTTNPANAGSDYVAIVNGSGSILAGGTSTTVSVTVSGDTTPEANETFFVNLTNITGATPGDTQGLGTITNDDVTITRIYTIQGSGMSSLLTGNTVTTIGIVTGKRSLGGSNNGFYIQDPTGDGVMNTSDGILVFTGSTVPTVNVGDFLQVTGNVTEFEPATTDEPDGIAPSDPKTATEITGATITLISAGNPLPTPVDVTGDNVLDPLQTSRGAQLEKYEFMRMSVSSLTVSQPTNDFGEFWGVETPRPRPFREPGIEAGDPIPNADEPPYAPGPPPFPPNFDGNFERIMVDSGAALTTGSTRRPQVQVTAGTLVTNVVGPLDYAFDNYRIVLDANATPGIAGGVTAATPVPVRAAGEFTIGHTNLENFGRSNGALVFPGRLNKASLAIRNVLQTPDIVGVIEVFDLASLQDLADKINSDVGNPSVVNYQAYLDESASTFSNSQDVGYLVNTARVTVVVPPVQYHRNDTFTYCGQTDLLHDRPAYLLNAIMPRAGGGTVPVTVILNHTKSLIATDSPRPYGSCGTGTEGARNREKRRLQAEDIADLIQTNSGGNLVVLGDLNAFDFNDGLGDIVGTFKGNPVPPEQVVEPSVDSWSYNLTNLLTTILPGEHYSLLFEGNAQALDHVLVNGQMLSQNTRFAYGRFNADFSESYASDTNRPERLSDHDAPVAYFLFPADNDGDGVPDANDNCPSVANTDQANADGDALGDACDACPNDPDNDQDGDGVCGNVDNCPTVANTDQANADGDALGDACDACPNDPNNDQDGDGVCGNVDNCPTVANTDQANADGDALGDACDACPADAANDVDGDGVCGNVDNCPTVANPDQANADGDTLGDACDACPADAANDIDGDGVCGNVDNCPTVSNPDQLDTDNDGTGDACTGFQFPAGGAFVIGDQVNLTGGATVYFWGSQWSQNNPMSGGSASNSFKGFEGGNTAPACSGTWTSSPGNSSNPPSTVPQYMAVIVSSSIQKNGSVLSGNITKIVIIQTNPGYGPSPGNAGTGKVVAIICSSSSLSSNLWRVADYPALASLSLDWMLPSQRWTARG